MKPLAFAQISALTPTPGTGGRFQGVAVGSRAARAVFAQIQGKQIIAEKTGVGSDEA